MESTAHDRIEIRGAQENNLKNINLDLVKGRLYLISGPSGSGKSSLAVDTLYKESCFKIEALSFLSSGGRRKKTALRRPAVRSIRGLPPVVLVPPLKQGGRNKTMASFLGLDLVLYRMALSGGRTLCLYCGGEIKKVLRSDIEDEAKKLVKELKKEETLLLSAGIYPEDKAKAAERVRYFSERGHSRFVIDGVYREFSPDDLSQAASFSEAELIVDQFLSSSSKQQLKEALDFALSIESSGIFVRAVSNLRHNAPLPQASAMSPEGICIRCRKKGISEPRGRDLLIEYGSSFTPLLDIYTESFSELSKKAVQFPPVLKSSPEYGVLSGIISLIDELGLSYLPLNRKLNALSRGELQRLWLTGSFAKSSGKLLYVLYEPTAGLHPKDSEKLKGRFSDLIKMGHTLAVVSNDAVLDDICDQRIVMGPGSGEKGGRVAAGELSVFEPDYTRLTWLEPSGFIAIKGAHRNNLKDIDLNLPLGVLCGVCGVSGSGKSSLIIHSLYPAIKDLLKCRTHEVKGDLLNCGIRDIKGIEHIKAVRALWNTSGMGVKKGDVGSFAGLTRPLSKLYAEAPISKQRGWKEDIFNPGSAEGKCKACRGRGYTLLDAVFGASYEIECPECQGEGFSADVLEVRLKGYTISETLSLTVERFSSVMGILLKNPSILKLLLDFNLGYLKISEPLSSLSAGELQRLKLAKVLSKGRKSGVLYLFDEPSYGLDSRETAHLASFLKEIAAEGNSVIAIEHDPLFISLCDYTIELGPGAGDAGGEVIRAGGRQKN